MTEIKLLPKFHDKKDIKAKFEELKTVKTELLATNKLTTKEIEFLHDGIDDFMNLRDAFSRNYVIDNVNMLMLFVRTR